MPGQGQGKPAQMGTEFPGKLSPCANELTIKILKILIGPGWSLVIFVLLSLTMKDILQSSLENAASLMLFYFKIIFFLFVLPFTQPSFIKDLFCD